MAKILYSAVTAEGSKTEGYVDALSAEAAREQLHRQGLRDVVLHQEVAMAQDPTELAGLSEQQARELARFSLRLRENPGLSTALAETARRSKWWLLGDALIIVAAWQMGLYSTVAVGLLVAAAPFAMTAWGWRRVDHYQQLLREHAVGNAQAVQALAAQLRPVSRHSAALDFDLDVRLASLTARAGDLPGALKTVQAWQARLADQPGLYEARVSTVHMAAGDAEGFVRLMGEAYERSGRDPSRGLDHVLAQARFGDAVQAQALLEGIDISLLPPMAKGFLPWARGLLQARRGDAQAVQPLGQAVSELLQMANQPAIWTVLALCSADHALALARSGDPERARQQVAKVWPVLQAHAYPALLQALHAQGLLPKTTEPPGA